MTEGSYYCAAGEKGLAMTEDEQRIKVYKVNGAYMDGPFHVFGNADMVMLADHERTVAGLCELLKVFRITHADCQAKYPIGDLIHDNRCDLCKRTDTLLAEHAETKGE